LRKLIYLKYRWLYTAGICCQLLILSCNNHHENHGVVDYKLFLAAEERRPLVVSFGGSEGGMAYANDETKNLRDSILSHGYHFLAVGYFGTNNTPEELDRISLDAIYDTIKNVSQQPLINQNQIALFGGSRGGELVLNLASRCKDITAVIAVVPPNVTLPSKFGWQETSSWSYKQKEIPWITASDESLKLIKNGDFYSGFSKMVEKQELTIESEIEVEKIDASILFISASEDEVWPSTLMCNRMMNRLKKNNFQHIYQHYELKGGHAEFTSNFGLIIEFLNEHVPIRK